MKISYKLALTLSAAVCVLAVVYYATRGEQTTSQQTADAQQVQQDKPARRSLLSDSSGNGSLASMSSKTQTNGAPDKASDSRAADLRARVQAAMADRASAEAQAVTEEPTTTQGPAALGGGSAAGIALARTDNTTLPKPAPTTEVTPPTADSTPPVRPDVPWPGDQTPQALKTSLPQAPAEPSPTKQYTVQPGDTFSSISIKLYDDELRWLDIAQANPMVDPTRLKVGQVLRIPDQRTLGTSTEPVPLAPDGVKTYKIRPGDSLSTVAEKFYGDPTLWRTIYNFNRNKIGPNPNAIQAGMTLKVPPRVRGAQ